MSFQPGDRVTLTERWEADFDNLGDDDSWVGIPGQIVEVRSAYKVEKGMFPFLILIEVGGEQVVIPVESDEIERIA